MARPLRASPWGHRLLFVALALTIIFARLLPLGARPGALPGPDLLLCIILCWMMRRPDFLPVWLIAMVALLDDLLLMRPPGLRALIIVLASEFLRSRSALTRELVFIIEWAVVAVMMVVMMLAYRLVFALALLPQPSAGLAIVEVAWSILLYPAVVGASWLFLGTRKPATGQTDDYGRRL